MGKNDAGDDDQIPLDQYEKKTGNPSGGNDVEIPFEQLKFISETFRKEFHHRRSFELGIIIPIITIYLASIVYVINTDIFFPDEIFSYVIVLIFYGSTTVISIFYLGKIHQGNNLNKGYAEVAEGILIQYIRGDNPEELKKKPQHKDDIIYTKDMLKNSKIAERKWIKWCSNPFNKNTIWGFVCQSILIGFLSLVAILLWVIKITLQNVG